MARPSLSAAASADTRLHNGAQRTHLGVQLPRSFGRPAERQLVEGVVRPGHHRRVAVRRRCKQRPVGEVHPLARRIPRPAEPRSLAERTPPARHPRRLARRAFASEGRRGSLTACEITGACARGAACEGERTERVADTRLVRLVGLVAARGAQRARRPACGDSGVISSLGRGHAALARLEQRQAVGAARESFWSHVARARGQRARSRPPLSTGGQDMPPPHTHAPSMVPRSPNQAMYRNHHHQAHAPPPRTSSWRASSSARPRARARPGGPRRAQPAAGAMRAAAARAATRGAEGCAGEAAAPGALSFSLSLCVFRSACCANARARGKEHATPATAPGPQCALASAPDATCATGSARRGAAERAVKGRKAKGAQTATARRGWQHLNL